MLRFLIGAACAVAFGMSATAAQATVESTYGATGPYATTTGTIANGSGTVLYKTYYPSNYAALGFLSPIVTWGNGTGATPDKYDTFLGHLASWGFTVVAAVGTNTGSGTAIDAAAHQMVTLNGTTGSTFAGKLDVTKVAAVGHSQGAGGATRATTSDPALITTLMTFSLPNTTWVGSNPDCPTAADCMYNPALLTRPAFFIGTKGLSDSIIASPATQTAFYNSVTGSAALGVIKTSGGKAADHNSIQDVADGGNPAGELGYATAWLRYRLRGDTTAAGAFSGTTPELTSNTNWSPSAVK
jgi:pimeloyl-ACP methyl ester carboxylesterase